MMSVRLPGRSSRNVVGSRLSTLQLRQEGRQVPEFPDRLKLPVLIEIEDAHAVDCNFLSGRGRQLKPPVDCRFVSAHYDFLDLGFDLAEGGDDGAEKGGDRRRSRNRRGSDRVLEHSVRGEVINETCDVQRTD